MSNDNSARISAPQEREIKNRTLFYCSLIFVRFVQRTGEMVIMIINSKVKIQWL